MFLPRFSLRLILAVVTALCLFSLVQSLAYQGRAWALAVCIAGYTAAVMAVLYAILFCGAWFLSLGFGRRRTQVESPFAGDRLPPMLVAPPPDLD